MTDEPVYEAVSPEGLPTSDLIVPTDPVKDLGTVRIAEFWDWRFKGDQMFRIVEDELRNRYPGVEFVPYQVFGDTHSHAEEEIVRRLPELLREHGCDAVLSAVGA